MLLAPMAQRLEGVHVGFLRQVNKLKAKSMRNGLWRKVEADKVIQGEGTQPIHTYLDRSQETVAKWVTLWPRFDVRTRRTGYKGEGKLRVLWWRKEKSEEQLRITLEEIFSAAREQR